MLKERKPGIFQFDIPLRNNPLRSLNAYLIKGEQSLMIDSGFDTDENMEIVMQALKEADIAPESLRLFLTHLHSDHTGLAARMEEKGVRVHMGSIDATILENSLEEGSPFWKSLEEKALTQGLEADQLRIEDNPGYIYRPKTMPKIQPTHAGEQFHVGDYSFHVIDLPGHTPGLQALYEPSFGYLFSSDHILETITPNITFWGESFGDALGEYLYHLERVKQMPVSQVFSSHRQLPEDHLKRIEEIISHHEHRLEECLQVLERNGPSTVRDVTRFLHWDIRAKSWDDFPKAQKWFAAGEAHAHLVHLREKGKIAQRQEKGVLYFERIV